MPGNVAERHAPTRVLIADDSGFFRRRVRAILESDPAIEVVACVENGLEAVHEQRRLRPDVVVMDVEMPVLNGIDAVRRIMLGNPVPVLILSSLSEAGARVTLEALEAGAVDYLPKSALGAGAQRVDLCQRVRTLSQVAPRSAGHAPVSLAGGARRRAARAAAVPAGARPALIAVGCSTGGPVALRELLRNLAGDYPVPLLLVQHMPEQFTATFAERLTSTCAIEVREARDGDAPRPGLALLAPGGRQLYLEGTLGQARVRLRAAADGEHYRPSVDLAFSSVASVFGERVLAVVLTGMGADGREGARELKARGARVWAQDEASSVVWGMPGSVVQAGLADQVFGLRDLASQLAAVR